MARIVAGGRTLAVEQLSLTEAENRVLATTVTSMRSLPPRDNSAMDGYAVRSSDVASAVVGEPVRLEVVETIAAGHAPTRTVGGGQAARIMTGATIPTGADCVIRVEDTDGGTDYVMVRSTRDVGRNIRPAGEDLMAGAVAFEAGTALGGAQLAFLAALGVTTVEVRRQPRVALLASGDELVPVERSADAHRGHGVVASNSLALAALLRRDGAIPVDLGIAGDSVREIAALAAKAADCDLLVTTGGASVGAFDYTRRALVDHRLELDFWRVLVRPGAQSAHGRLLGLDGLPWLGLPGNPVSAQVTYELFVRPLLRLQAGHSRFYRSTVAVTLETPVSALDAEYFLPRARLSGNPDGTVSARLTGPQRSNLLSSMAHADALLVLPSGGGIHEAGTMVRALPLDSGGLHGTSSPW